MPLWKYVANRALTAFQNLLTGAKLSEYHTGYRAYSAAALRKLPLLANSDDFVFDNQLLVQAVAAGVVHRRDLLPDALRAGIELDQLPALACATGWACVATTLAYRAWRWGLARPRFLAFESADFVAGRLARRSSCAPVGSSPASPLPVVSTCETR